MTVYLISFQSCTTAIPLFLEHCCSKFTSELLQAGAKGSLLVISIKSTHKLSTVAETLMCIHVQLWRTSTLVKLDPGYFRFIVDFVDHPPITSKKGSQGLITTHSATYTCNPSLCQRSVDLKCLRVLPTLHPRSTNTQPSSTHTLLCWPLGWV